MERAVAILFPTTTSVPYTDAPKWREVLQASYNDGGRAPVESESADDVERDASFWAIGEAIKALTVLQAEYGKQETPTASGGGVQEGADVPQRSRRGRIR